MPTNEVSNTLSNCVWMLESVKYESLFCEKLHIRLKRVEYLPWHTLGLEFSIWIYNMKMLTSFVTETTSLEFVTHQGFRSMHRKKTWWWNCHATMTFLQRDKYIYLDVDDLLFHRPHIRRFKTFVSALQTRCSKK